MRQQIRSLKLCWVITKGDYLHVYDSEGKQISGTIMTRLTDKYDEPTELLVKMIVNMASSEEEMRQMIEEFKSK